MIRSWFWAQRQKKAQAAFARKWMVEEGDTPGRATVVGPSERAHSAPGGLLARLRSSWLVRIAAGSTGALMATGGMAYAGVLPAPMQRAASNLADRMGMDLPRPEGDEVVAVDSDDSDDEEGTDANEAGDKGSSTSKAVHEVIERKAEFDSGRDFGHAVRDAAHAANEERKAAKAEAPGRGKAVGHSKEDGAQGPPAHAAVNEKGPKEHPVKDDAGAPAAGPPAKPEKPSAPQEPVEEDDEETGPPPGHGGGPPEKPGKSK